MKICILTQPLGANYGGVLQAYALQKVLEDMGHTVTTLRFPVLLPWIPKGYKKPITTLLRFASKYLKGNKSIACCDPDRQTRYAYQELFRFVDSHIRCMPVSAPVSRKMLPDFDAYIVGSDQVWRPLYSPFLPNFFLDFLADAPVKRIAYAASFGVDTWEADEEMTAIIRPLAQRFDAISVREESGVALCEEFLGVQAEVMPDPTLLLTAADYLRLCPAQENKQEAYIAAYILDRGDRENSFIDRISTVMGLPVKNIGDLDWSIHSDSVESWIEGIAHASFVITNSFHGTIFSLLFKRDFCSIVHNGRGASRFTSLLRTVGIQDHLIDETQLEHYTPSNKPIDYEEVMTILSGIREKGYSFLSAHI